MTAELRILKAARGLFRRYQNPEVVAFNNARNAKTQSRALFWSAVGNFLFRPYPGMAWTGDDVQRWTLIRAENLQ